MTQEELISLGFKRTDVSAEESGDYAFYYYDLDFGSGRAISLISSDNHEAEKNGEWHVEVFEDNTISYNNYQDVSEFIRIVNKGIKK